MQPTFLRGISTRPFWQNIGAVAFAEDGGGDSAASGDGQSKTSSGGGQSKSAKTSGGTQNSLTLDDIPQNLYQEIFQKGLNKGVSKLENRVQQRMTELGVTEENLEKWKELEDAEARKEEEKLKAKGEFDKVRQKLIETHQAELEKTNKERDGILKQLEDVLIGKQVLAAAAKMDAYNAEDVGIILARRFKLDKSDNGAYRVIAVDAAGEVDLDDHGNSKTVEAVVKEYLDANPHQVKSRVRPGGSGAQPARSGNGRFSTPRTAQEAIASALTGGSKFASRGAGGELDTK